MNALVRFAVSMALTSPAAAQTANTYFLDAVACPGCSASEIVDRARLDGLGMHFIYDLPGHRLQLIRVECKETGGETHCGGGDADVPTPAQDLFDRYAAAVAANGGSEAFAHDVDVSLPSLFASVGKDGRATQYPFLGARGEPHDDDHINAYDTLAVAQLESQVERLLKDPSKHAGAYAQVLDVVSSGMGEIIGFAGMTIAVDARFRDGSHRRYRLDRSALEFKPVPDTATDSHGNLIPTNPPAPKPGTRYRFDDRSANAWDITNIGYRLLPAGLPRGRERCRALEWTGVDLVCVTPR